MTMQHTRPDHRGKPAPDFSDILQMHVDGRIDEAASYYRSLLAKNPSHFDALHFLGVARFQQGRLDEASDCIGAALKLNPSSAPALSNLGLALAQMGRTGEALAHYDEALALMPDYAEALNNRGVALMLLERPAEALASYDKALAIWPDYPQALANRGNALRALGRAEEALASYDEALAIQPDYAEALDNRGIALVDLGRPDEALASHDMALAIRPDVPEALNNRGAALAALGRPAEALESYESALAIRPDYAETLHNRGLALVAFDRREEALASFERVRALDARHVEARCAAAGVLAGLDRREEALKSYEEALAIAPKNIEALIQRGILLTNFDRPLEALASFDSALALQPDNAEALACRGVALAMSGRHEEALAQYDKSLAIQSDNPQALTNRGVALTVLDRLREALASFDEALMLKPDHAEAYANRGVALALGARHDEALASYDKALAINPVNPGALDNRGVALTSLGRPHEALPNHDKALALKPDYAEAYYNRGVALTELGLPEEGAQSCDRSLALKPDYQQALFARGAIALLLGDYQRGWKGYESRWDCKGLPARAMILPCPEWRGETLRGKRIIVYEEQGSGDVLQFSRYLLALSSMGAQVTFYVRANIHRLLRSLGAKIRLTESHQPGARYDYQCALMSLPAAFGANFVHAPTKFPYLAAEAPLVRKWRRRIGDHGLKIGIAWQGSLAKNADRGRSMPLRFFQAIGAVPGVRLISLQKGFGSEQIADLPATMVVETFDSDMDQGADAFTDTAAVMTCLDLIVTCDTSIAHLAGALGRPVWLALKRVAEWRWLLDRTDTPWYPTMKLYRQPSRDDWASVFDRIAADVAGLKPKGARAGFETPQIPVPVGELFDKITILKIKAARVTDPAKLSNIMTELALLRRTAKQYGKMAEDERRLISRLKRANERLWALEDAIRDCERKNDFDAKFVSVARSIYKTNDRRAAIKKQINTVFLSSLAEEKSYVY